MADKTDEQIELKVESPVPGPDSGWFALHLPSNLDPDEGFAIVEQHVEFRRKCMNQGFDNLIELLRMTRDSIKRDMAVREAREAKQPKEEPNDG